MLARRNNSLRVDTSLHSDTLFWFRDNQSLVFFLNAACLAKKQQIPISYPLVWPDRSSNPRSTALEVITLTIMPPIPLHTSWNRGAEYCTDTTPTHDVKSLCRMLYCSDSHTMQIRCALNYTVTRHAQCETILYKIALSRPTHDLKLCGEYYTVRTCIRCEFVWKNIVLSRHTQNVKTLCRTWYCHDLHTM